MNDAWYFEIMAILGKKHNAMDVKDHVSTNIPDLDY